MFPFLNNLNLGKLLSGGLGGLPNLPFSTGGLGPIAAGIGLLFVLPFVAMFLGPVMQITQAVLIAGTLIFRAVLNLVTTLVLTVVSFLTGVIHTMGLAAHNRRVMQAAGCAVLVIAVVKVMSMTVQLPRFETSSTGWRASATGLASNDGLFRQLNVRKF